MIRRFKAPFASVIFASMLGFGQPSALAQSHAPHYRACSLPLAPQSMPDEQGRPSGLAVEVLQEVSRGLGWAVEIEYMPWLRVVGESKLGRCDLVLTVLKRSDYETFLHFPIEPVVKQSNVLIVRRGSGIRYDGDLEAFMRRYSIGMYNDKAVDDRFEALRRAKWARVEGATDAVLNLKKLMAGRFDAAIENDITAAYELQRLGKRDEVEFLSPPLNVTDAYIGIPKAGRLADRVIPFSQALAGFRRTPEFAARLRYWGGVSP